MKNLASATVAIFLCFSTLNANADTKRHVFSKTDIQDIAETREENQARFNIKYKGKIFKDNLIFSSLTSSGYDDWSMHFGNVICLLTEADANKYIDLNTGDNLSVTGYIFESFNSTHIILRNCKIIKQLGTGHVF
jgi:hypothetical protein